MNVRKLTALLEANDLPISIMLPSGEFVPEHFHITEIGRIHKDFVDCGGYRRKIDTCLMQVWTAHDFDHRLKSEKLSKIVKLAEAILQGNTFDLPVEIEYGEEFASQYKLVDVEVTPKGLLFILGGKHTECLAPDKCGVSGCC